MYMYIYIYIYIDNNNNDINRIPFGDHPLNMERYRED